MKNDYPKSVKILNIVYEISYHDNPSEVDLFKRSSLWGEIDPWTRTIRIYDNGRNSGDVWQSIWHEIIHGIAFAFHIDDTVNDDNEVVDLLATGLTSVISENGWVGFSK